MWEPASPSPEPQPKQEEEEEDADVDATQTDDDNEQGAGPRQPPPPQQAVAGTVKGRGKRRGRSKSKAAAADPGSTEPAAAAAAGAGQRQRRKRGRAAAAAAEGGGVEEEEAGVGVEGGAEGGGKGRKKKGRQQARWKGAAVVGSEGLPGAFAGLWDLYDAVDTVVCFLLKGALPPTVRHVTVLVTQLYGGPPKHLTDPTTADLTLLCAIAPKALALHYVPVTDRAGLALPSLKGKAGQPQPPPLPPPNTNEEEGDGRFRLELSFPTFGGVGKGHAKKRREAMRTALLEAAIQAHARFLSTLPPAEAAAPATTAGAVGEGPNPTTTTINPSHDVVGQWHPRFKPEGREGILALLPHLSVALPDPPSTLAEAKSTDPYHAPPAPLVPLGATGHVKSRHQHDDEQDDPSSPFTDAFLNNVPAERVPRSKGECVGLDGVLGYLQGLPFYKDQVVHVKDFPGAEARYGSLDTPLVPSLQRALESKGVTRLFLHQARAINAAMRGQHIAIATATSSGKSVVYNTPILHTILANAEHGVPARALYLFPTKALAQDQLRALRELLASHPELAARVTVETYDGDTPFPDRQPIREHAHIILSNPDMLHQSICPQHKQWQGFLSALRYIVIDEAHMYTGVFGSHVACVLRRLLRLCLRYARGQEQDSLSQGPTLALPVPQFILCSATVANPLEHFAHLLPLHDVLGGPEKLTVVDEDTSPRGRKVFVVWNPPLKELPPAYSSFSTAGMQQPHTRRHGSRRDMRNAVLASVAASSHRQQQQQQQAGADPIIKHEQEDEEEEEQEALAPLLLATTQEGDGIGGGDGDGIGDGEGAVAAAAAVAVSVGGIGGVEGDGKEEGEGGGGDSTPVKDEPAAQQQQGGEGMGMEPRRRSSIVETAMLFAALVKQRVRTLAFCKVRKLVEMVLRYTLQDLRATAPALAPMVKGYRGGYTKEDRRAIEAALFGGELLGVTATCALELGVDVGSLDATLHMGFPGSAASLWQQAGRAGRGGKKDSMAILVCFDSPVDQFFAQHPTQLLTLPPERAVCDPHNPCVLRGQLLCAADEAPVGGRYLPGSLDRAIFGGTAFDEALAELIQAGHLLGPLPDGSYRKGEWLTNPQRSVSIRMIDPVTFEVLDESRGQVIDSVGYTRAFFELFEGAIYMHQARQYLVTKLDLLHHRAKVRPVRVAYYTASRNHVDVNLTKKLEASEDGTVSSGCAQVVAKVWGYRKIWLQSNRIFETGVFSLPPLEYETKGFFIDLPLEIQSEVEAAGLCYQAGIHAANHALLAVTPLFLKTDPGDIETEHTFPYQNRPRPPRLLVYDKRPGGIGAAESLFSCVDAVLSKALALVGGCPCLYPTGCPGCVSDFRCSDYNVVLDKQAAILILRALLKTRGAHSADSTAIDEKDVKVPPVVAAAAVGGGEDGGEGKGQEGMASLGDTPRKAARKRALKMAKAMDGARARDLSLQRSWAASFPNYRPEVDND